MQKPRSFTVRVPYDTYIAICDLAQQEGKKLNAKVNDLISLGLGKTVDMNETLRAMLLTHIDAENAK